MSEKPHSDFPIHEKQKVSFSKFQYLVFKTVIKYFIFHELKIAFHCGSFKIKWCQKIYFSGVLSFWVHGQCQVCKNQLQFYVHNAELDGKPFEIFKCYWPEPLTITNETFFSDSDKLSVLEYSKSNHKFLFDKKVKV